MISSSLSPFLRDVYGPLHPLLLKPLASWSDLLTEAWLLTFCIPVLPLANTRPAVGDALRREGARCAPVTMAATLALIPQLC
ncbi:hypothetical protein QQF64_008271 [Cirrhinus molitorella]|uniref:Uncharacterized protein n=1 Tax=Cirrhinus molitorella TaxID=172907 RepID=A0ABR3M920_9TELE